MRSLGKIPDTREYRFICKYCGEILAFTNEDIRQEVDRVLLPLDSSCNCLSCGRKLYFQKSKLEVLS